MQIQSEHKQKRWRLVSTRPERETGHAPISWGITCHDRTPDLRSLRSQALTFQAHSPGLMNIMNTPISMIRQILYTGQLRICSRHIQMMRNFSCHHWRYCRTVPSGDSQEETLFHTRGARVCNTMSRVIEISPFQVQLCLMESNPVAR